MHLSLQRTGHIIRALVALFSVLKNVLVDHSSLIADQIVCRRWRPTKTSLTFYGSWNVSKKATGKRRHHETLSVMSIRLVQFPTAATRCSWEVRRVPRFAVQPGVALLSCSDADIWVAYFHWDTVCRWQYAVHSANDVFQTRHKHINAVQMAHRQNIRRFLFSSVFALVSCWNGHPVGPSYDRKENKAT